MPTENFRIGLEMTCYSCRLYECNVALKVVCVGVGLGQVLWLTVVIVPLLSLSLMAAHTDAQVMQNATSKIPTGFKFKVIYTSSSSRPIVVLNRV